MNQQLKNKKASAWRRGVKSELVSSLYLALKGYRILARRYKTPVGEVDLVVRKKNMLIFVEVKQRQSKEEGIFSISARQRRRIERAAQYYLSRHAKAGHLSIRFDAIAITPMCWPKHIISAWRFGE